MNGVMVATYRVKGGELDTRIVRDPTIRAAMIDYLEASGRLEGMTEETPIWTRHDRAGQPGGPLSSHAFVKNLKRYAQDAGIGALHLHQLRHTLRTHGRGRERLRGRSSGGARAQEPGYDAGLFAAGRGEGRQVQLSAGGEVGSSVMEYKIEISSSVGYDRTIKKAYLPLRRWSEMRSRPMSES